VIATPVETGVHVIEEQSLEELAQLIDWTPLFHVWELRGSYPRIFDDPRVGEKAREIHADALQLLDEIIGGGFLQARGVWGLFPAHSVGEDVVVYADSSRTDVLTTFHFIRQQTERGEGRNVCLADYVAPRDSGLADHIGAFAVTTGHGLGDLCARFENEGDDYRSIMAKALADRLAEAFAELVHRTIREHWGCEGEASLSHEDLIRERYRGIRPAPGYPACPDHTEKRTLFDLLGAEEAADIHLTESFAMAPASSVSALCLAHPEAKYFGVGEIGRDQVEDLAARKRVSVEEVERWLAPNLGYEVSR
jgi:5-methyltetrahydrofolate--homocysteine methyltransferase